MSNLIKVLLVDDHAPLRGAYRRLLESEHDIRVVAEAANSRDAVDRTLALHPDVVIMAFTLPDASGIDVARRLLASQPQLAVLICSFFDDAIFAMHALQAGARGFITKGSAPENLVRAIHCVAGGGRFFSAEALRNSSLQ